MNRRAKKTKPNLLILFLTKRCNSRCPHCFWVSKSSTFFHTSSDTDISLAEAKEIIDAYYKMGVRKIKLQSEGEVLLYDHLVELSEYCSKKGIRILGMATNGIKVDEYIDFISNNVRHITVSLDGWNAKTYIEHRGGTESTFNKIIDNIKQLVHTNKCRVYINSVIHNDNFDQSIYFVELAESLGVSTIRFSNFHPISKDEKLKPVSLSNIKSMKNIFSERDNKVKITIPKTTPVKGPFYCSMLFKNALIGSQGNMSPCCRINTDSSWGKFSLDGDKHNSKTLQSFRKTFIKAKTLMDLPLNCRQCSRIKRKG
jgi:MoaA/NifB/PqqE/SkfB family radical SAM enzyme